MFPKQSRTEIIISATFILWSANAFNLVTSKVLSVGKDLTLSRTTNFRLVQTERVCRDNFKLYENGKEFPKRVENTVGKGEIARYEQFLRFSKCFQKTGTADT